MYCLVESSFGYSIVFTLGWTVAVGCSFSKSPIVDSRVPRERMSDIDMNMNVLSN